MRWMLVVCFCTMLSVSTAGAPAQTDAQPTGAETWDKLLAANDLDVEGHTPFHLGMTFQLYDLNGTATEKGSFEVWWAAPGSKTTAVHLPGLNEDGSTSIGADASLTRSSILVQQLVDSAIHPISKSKPNDELTNWKLKSGNIQLDCVGPKPEVHHSMNAPTTTLCVASQTTDLLVIDGLDGKERLIRLKTGKFHDTNVALALHLSYLGRPAITGDLSVLQAFDPEKSDVKLPVPTNRKPQVVSVSGGVIAGHRIKFVQPEYPAMGKLQHLSGTTMLSATIATDGTVEGLVPLASTAPMFTEAAVQAVKKWVYSPYLLNGEPTKVDTTITVNFVLNPMN